MLFGPGPANHNRDGRDDSADTAQFECAKIPAMTASVGIVLKSPQMISALARANGAPMPVSSLVEELDRKLLLDGFAEASSGMVRL